MQSYQKCISIKTRRAVPVINQSTTKLQNDFFPSHSRWRSQMNDILLRYEWADWDPIKNDRNVFNGWVNEDIGNVQNAYRTWAIGNFVYVMWKVQSHSLRAVDYQNVIISTIINTADKNKWQRWRKYANKGAYKGHRWVQATQAFHCQKIYQHICEVRLKNNSRSNSLNLKRSK